MHTLVRSLLFGSQACCCACRTFFRPFHRICLYLGLPDLAAFLGFFSLDLVACFCFAAFACDAAAEAPFAAPACALGLGLPSG